VLDAEEDEDDIAAARDEVASEVTTAAALTAETSEVTFVERVVEKIIERPMRKRLPDTRQSITHHFNVAGHEGYLTVGKYKDGSPGELFITMSKEGSTIGGLMDSLGTAISVALQYGVPVASLVTKFAHQRFEPQGMTTNKDIPFAKSLVDYIFRWMGMEFVDGYREANAPARPSTTSIELKEEVSDRMIDDERIADGPRSTRPTDGDRPVVNTPATVVVNTDGTQPATAQLNAAQAAMMGDAPPCDGCGSITVRNGTCYKCMNCGNSMGCS
jgi:ribonucleoside-diphosphate reductase alpha chain